MEREALRMKVPSTSHLSTKKFLRLPGKVAARIIPQRIGCGNQFCAL